MQSQVLKVCRGLQAQLGIVVIVMLTWMVAGCETSKSVYIDDHKELPPYVVQPPFERPDPNHVEAEKEAEVISNKEVASDARN